MEKRKPERQCTGCGKKGGKENFIRIVKTSDGMISLDISGKASGRGAYVCCDVACIDKMCKGRRLDRAFRTHVDEAIYRSILEEFNKLEK